MLVPYSSWWLSYTHARSRTWMEHLLHPQNFVGPTWACTTQGLSQVSCPPPVFLVSKELFRESRFSLCRGLPGILQTIMLAHNQASQICYNFRCFPLAHSDGNISCCAVPRGKSSCVPSFLRGAHTPLEFSSLQGQLRWGIQSLRDSEKIIIFFSLCSFSPHMVGATFFAVFLILMRSRSPASFLRNIQTILTCPAKPGTVLFAYLSSQILSHSPLLHSLHSSNKDLSVPQRCQVFPIPQSLCTCRLLSLECSSPCPYLLNSSSSRDPSFIPHPLPKLVHKLCPHSFSQLDNIPLSGYMVFSQSPLVVRLFPVLFFFFNN